MVGGFDVLLIIAGGVVDCEDDLTAMERGAQERCVGARAMAGGNIRATAVPGLGSSAMESWERAQQEFKGGRGCASDADRGETRDRSEAHDHWVRWRRRV